MNKLTGSIRRGRLAAMSAMALVLIGSAAPVLAQDTLAEARIRRMEAEIRALQRQVFPGGDGKFFTPEITRAPATGTPAAGQPASTPITDLLSRMETVEAQLQRLTAQIEQNGNRLSQLEARIGAGAAGDVATSVVGSAAAPAASAAAAPTPAPTPASTPAPTANLNAMTGGASAPRPASPAAATPAAAPSSQRVAAVRAIEKPQTSDPGDDEYSYGFRLWDAKFYPEAQQQLKLFLEKYPRHSRASLARNLLGRAYLDDGKPRDAATWFLQNFQADKQGARAADSLLFLAEAMKQLKDNNRTCIALAEFRETYAAEAVGRLKSQYDATRNGVTCSG